jgi:hypothetical protein
MRSGSALRTGQAARLVGYLLASLLLLATLGACGDDDSGGDGGDTATTAGVDAGTGDGDSDDDGTDDSAAGSDEMCSLFERVSEIDAETNAKVGRVVTSILSLDPETDDMEAEQRRLIEELQAIVAEIDAEEISDLYTRLAEVVPEDLRDDAIALRDGTLEILEILAGLEVEDLDDFQSQFNTPGAMAAGEAALALGELSQSECGVSIAN